MELIDYNIAITFWESNKYIDCYDFKHIYHSESMTSINQLMLEEITSSNTTCPNCTVIDKLCNSYYSSNNKDEKDKLIKEMLKLEINGYKLLQFYESKGYILLYINKINNIEHFLYGYQYDLETLNKLKKLDPKINDKICLMNAKWCSVCGARKPDIL